MTKPAELAGLIEAMAINPKGGKMASIAYLHSARLIRERLVDKQPAQREASAVALNAEMLAALKAVQPEMRREHNAGDGHFSTEQVEAVETAISHAEGRKP